MKRVRAWPVVLVAAGLLAYSGGFHGAWVFDDFSSIADNLSIRHLGPPWHALHPPRGGLTVSGRPILNLSLAFNYAASGLRVFGYHAVNLAIHLGAALLLFGVLRRTLGVPDLVSGTAALLWELHPLQTESVQYVVQRAESLMGLFYLLTLYAFIRWTRPSAGPPRLGWAVLSAAACLLGMGTKEVMVSAPVVVWLYDRTFVAGGFIPALRARKGYYLSLALSWLWLAALVAANRGRGGTAGFGGSFAALPYWASQGPALFNYLRLVVCPYPLAIDYGLRWLGPSPWELPAVAAAVALLAVSLWALFAKRAWGFAGFCFFAVLAPTSLVPGGRQTMAEHRMYLAMAPLAAGLALGAWHALRRVTAARRAAVFVGACLLLGGTWGALTWARCRDYSSGVALWSDLTRRRPEDANAWLGLGGAYYQAGRLEEALAALRTATRLGGDPQAHYALGRVDADLQRWDEAQVHYEAALSARPQSPETEIALGNLFKLTGRPKDAAPHYQRAIALDPENPAAHNDLGVALRLEGRPAEASREFERAISLDPDMAEAHENLGVASAEQGLLGPAILQLEEAFRRDPANRQTRIDLSAARNNFGIELARAGKFEQAVLQFEEALRANPGNDGARLNLQRARQSIGR